jgi:hypothetical protein
MKYLALLLVAGRFFSAVAVEAQEPSRGPDGGTSRTHVSGVGVLAISGKPFSANTSTDWTRTLADGSTVTMHLDAFLARDSKGRIYRERHRFVPAGSKDPSPLYEIHLTDPIAKTDLLCDTEAHVCKLSVYKPQTSFEAPSEGTYDQGTQTFRRESLGTDKIEGISVLGTRETTTMVVGAHGNDQPILSTREFWYCDELQNNLAVTRIDPGNGKQIIRLSHISRTEPDSHLWDVPTGFKVQDVRASSGASTAPPAANAAADSASSRRSEHGGVEILSDTDGVDFSNYLKTWHEITEATWNKLMPDEAGKPILRKGVVAIRFDILPDGHLKSKSMILEGRSGDTALDRAAWGALTGSDYQPLPSEFHGPYLELRAVFLYNMQAPH